MRAASAWLTSLAALVLGAGALGARNASRYGFYRSMGNAGMWSAEPELGTRRVFGGAAAELAEFPAACALLDRYWTARCSCAVLAARWALTAAHCVSPSVAYVKYNARRPSSPDGDVAPVHYLYRHPGYKVVQEDEGRGMDVTLLHHDVGLVRARAAMQLAAPPPTPQADALRAMRLYNPVDLKNEEVQVLGFGRTEQSVLGEELFAVRLQLVFCERGAWFHCLCGVATGRDPRGVCSGDSGGPVLYHGTQVGVTSMGPLECARTGATLASRGGRRRKKGAEAEAAAEAAAQADAPAAGATSVFTALYSYADLINATIHDTEEVLRMRLINASPRPPRPPRPPYARAALALLLVVLPARLSVFGHFAII